MKLYKEIDDRSTAEQLRDLGLEVIRKNKKTVADTTWVKKHVQKKPRPPRVTVGDTYLYFNVVAAKLINYPASYGVGTYEGQKVLLVKMDPDGYKAEGPGPQGGGLRVTNTTLARYLQRLGLGKGRHELIKINGGWMGVPEE